MEIKKTIVGYLEENCYLIKDGNKGLIVDPGDEIDKILDMIGDTKIIGVLITHAHFDHIVALDDLLKEYNVPIYYHNINKELNYEKLIDVKEQEYKIDNFIFSVIYTPGHRNDSVTYLFKDTMFTGDFLFHLSIGRTDMEYGNYNEMIESIDKILEYSDNIDIYPGHGVSSNLGIEKRDNSFCIKE